MRSGTAPEIKGSVRKLRAEFPNQREGTAGLARFAYSVDKIAVA